ncbi:hypothetical protein BLX87_20040 [Bacillus sp. VT-16-64]|nr:hypothetical protein BLX87_20040 [Bacillus sp. VT-16-64]
MDEGHFFTTIVAGYCRKRFLMRLHGRKNSHYSPAPICMPVLFRLEVLFIFGNSLTVSTR